MLPTTPLVKPTTHTALEQDYRDLSGLLPKLLDRQLIPLLIQVYCVTRISEVRKRKREDFDLERGTMQVALGTAKNKASVRTIPLPPKVVELLKQFPFEKGWGTALSNQSQAEEPQP